MLPEIPRMFRKAKQERKEKEDEIRKVKTCCRACIANCGVIATVKNGRVVKLEGNPEDRMSKGRMCAKGLSGIQALYHPNRNKYPMMRVGKRGANKWRRISWEKAIDIIARKLVETKQKYGSRNGILFYRRRRESGDLEYCPVLQHLRDAELV